MRLRDMKKQTQNKPNTNPIKPNLVRHSLGEGGFKRDTLLLCGVLLRTSFAGMTILKISAFSVAKK